MASTLPFHNLECWQINLHRCKAASYYTCKATKNVRSALVLPKEPWTHASKTRSKLPGWNIFQGIKKGNRPRACIYATRDFCCSLMSMFLDRRVTRNSQWGGLFSAAGGTGIGGLRPKNLHFLQK